MRRLLTTACLCLALPIAACSDDGGGGKTTGDTTATSTTDTSSDATSTTDTATSTTDTATTTTTTQDTSVSQDTSPPVETVDTSGTCPGIIECLADCPTPVTQACQTACLGKGDATAQQAVAGLIQCQGGCFPKNGTTPRLPTTNDEWRDTYDCLYENCVDEVVTCESGGVFGAGNCLALNNCLVDCEDSACSIGCMNGSTEAAATNLYKLEFCIASQCYDMNSVPTVPQACAQQAQQTQPCSLDYNQCLGDVGAAPAAGGGGGADSRDARGASRMDAERARLILELAPQR
ncbi:MAG: hypothetical protein IT385_20440 [Deltaproteobacteria bacterium]|nr:hypothetical protein [Deltaproteobacteria bacterium]